MYHLYFFNITSMYMRNFIRYFDRVKIVIPITDNNYEGKKFLE